MGTHRQIIDSNPKFAAVELPTQNRRRLIRVFGVIPVVLCKCSVVCRSVEDRLKKNS